MQRQRCQSRPAWREQVEATGLTYHTHAEGPYRNEEACYGFSAAEIDELERAARTP